MDVWSASDWMSSLNFGLCAITAKTHGPASFRVAVEKRGPKPQGLKISRFWVEVFQSGSGGCRDLWTRHAGLDIGHGRAFGLFETDFGTQQQRAEA